MSRIPELNLIRLFTFYLALMLVIGLYRRRKVYRDVVLLLGGFFLRRWPRLLGRMNRHRREIVNWPTLGPLVLALGLMGLQMTASRILFPKATITIRDLSHPWWQWVLTIVAAVPMIAVDFYFILRVGRFDHMETVKYFDQAETWAGTLRSKAVRMATFGRVNPDRMVDQQVRDGMKQLGGTLTWVMWWVSTQVTLRLVFGLVLWSMWAINR